MDRLKEASNKITKLEQRLDNITFSTGLKVSEVKKEFSDEVIASLGSRYTLFKTKKEVGDSLVLQGVIKLFCDSACEVCVQVECDGFVSLVENFSVSEGEKTLSIIKALTEVGKSSEIVLVLSATQNCKLLSYDVFIWGDSESLELEELMPSKISADWTGSHCAFCLATDSRGYVSITEGFPNGLEFSDFEYFANCNHLVPVFFDPEKTGEDSLYLFYIGPTGVLSFTKYKSDTFYLGAFSASSVSAVKSENENAITVVFATGCEVYYFTFDGVDKSENILLYSFDEPVAEVSLTKECDSTNYLAVGLQSGKNYLFASITNRTLSQNNSYVYASGSVEF